MRVYRGNGNLHSQIAESWLESRATSQTVPGYQAIELSRGLFNVIGQINLAIPDGGSTDVRALCSLFIVPILSFIPPLCVLAVSRYRGTNDRIIG